MRFEKSVFDGWMAEDPRTALQGDERVPQFRRKLLRRVRDMASMFLSQSTEMHEVFGMFHGTVGKAMAALAGGEAPGSDGAVKEALAALTEGTGKLPSRLQQIRDYRTSFNGTSADDFRPFGLEVRPFPAGPQIGPPRRAAP